MEGRHARIDAGVAPDGAEGSRPPSADMRLEGRHQAGSFTGCASRISTEAGSFTGCASRVSTEAASYTGCATISLFPPD